VEVKQRRPTEKHWASVGGVWLLVSHWKSLTVGFGTGNPAALAAPGPAATAMAAAQARAAPDITGCLSRRSKERTICTSIVAGMHRLPNGSVLAAANGQNSATCQQRLQEDVFAAQPVYLRRF